MIYIYFEFLDFFYIFIILIRVLMGVYYFTIARRMIHKFFDKKELDEKNEGNRQSRSLSLSTEFQTPIFWFDSQWIKLDCYIDWI